MDVLQAIKERRSIRKYRTEPIAEETLHIILEAARWAPSWANTQCWRLILVRDRITRSKLADAVRTTKPEGKNAATEAVRKAPIVIVACAERGLSGCYTARDKLGITASEKGEWWFMFDLGLAMQNLTLAAHAFGLGTVHVGMFDAAAVTRLLSIPNNVIVVELIPMGYPDEKPSIRTRKDVSEFVFYDRYKTETVIR